MSRASEPLRPTRLTIYISTGKVQSMQKANNLATRMLALLERHPVRNTVLINDLRSISADIEIYITNYESSTQERKTEFIERLLARTATFLDNVAERSQSTQTILDVVLPPTATEEMSLNTTSPPAPTSVRSLFVGMQQRPQPQAEALPHRTPAILITGRNDRDLYVTDQDSSVWTNPSSVRTRARRTDSFGMSRMSLENDEPVSNTGRAHVTGDRPQLSQSMESVRDPVLPWTEKLQLSQGYLPNAPFSTPPDLSESRSLPAPLPLLETLFQHLTFAVDEPIDTSTSDLVDPPVAGPSQLTQPARNRFYMPEGSEKASQKIPRPFTRNTKGRARRSIFLASVSEHQRGCVFFGWHIAS